METVDFLLFCFPITSAYYQPLKSLCLDPAELLLSVIFKCLSQAKKNPEQLSPVIFLPAIRKQVCLFFNECKRMQIAVRKSLGNEFGTSLFRLLHVYQLSPGGGKARAGCYFRKSLVFHA